MTLHGKTVLVTGSTGGIGKETARGLARLGARVVLVGRDADRARAAAAELRTDTGNDEISALTADVTRRGDLHRLAEAVTARHDTLDVLVNNAGVTMERRELTEDGVETTFAANVIAPYTLTRLLRPALARARAARVVNITGGVPRGRIDVDNLQGERAFVGLSHYNQTKLALMAMSYTFAEHLTGTGVTLNVAYPGHAYTSMNQSLTTGAYPAPARPIVPLLRLAMPVLYGHRAVVKASRSSVHLAASPHVEGVHQTYFNTRSRATPWPDAVLDERTRDTIWALCGQLAD
ncbi:SDR family NAD(P)-dependent oxidoreductase [Glycomyces sp. A-F 0318]|uniref:SDR family NAD(P)-dependent oxidoreductase n=1 Tax=Glycomyces amatae TaxID=2881355 RepID=UPI001E60C708|nr:SDR family NAD(P)-dependent oxidoreductase [Glycomyces amatae]MCD0443904.1 SDR family NAD(P)-dependent oxidoreductase [Glycomyces amatae]